MRLRKFQVKGFRCIKDSGVVSVKDITALIGRNESGKTALLQALLLLNKDSVIVDVDLTDGLEREVGKAGFRIVEGTFELTDEEVRAIQSLGIEVVGIKEIVVFREAGSEQPKYDFLGVEFPKIWRVQDGGLPPFTKTLATLRTTLADYLKTLPPAVESLPVAEKAAATIQFKELQRLDGLLKKLTEEKVPVYARVQEAVALLSTLRQSPEVDKVLKEHTNAFQNAASSLFKELDGKTEVETFVRSKLHPRFVYFSTYKTIHGAIKLSQFLASGSQSLSEKLDSGENLDKRETIENLFFLAELDPKRLDSLKSKIAAHSKYLQECSRNLTQEIQRAWRQEDSKVECEILHGDDIVRLRISDLHPDGSRTNQQLLQRRSEGFRWQFSFHVNFRAETKKAELHEAILLLDEPGLHLHPAQQDGLLDVLRDLAKGNQILYSTHSPFMIFKYDEGNLLLVEIDASSHLSTVSSAFWNGEPEAIIPILHSLGAKNFRKLIDPELAQALAPILVVEGGTDYKYIKTFNCLFRVQNQEGTLKRETLDFDIQPANGSPAIGPWALFNTHIGHRVVALYDNEPDAQRHSDELKKNGFPSERILLIQASGKQESDIEDMFSETEYLTAVNELYRQVLKSSKYVAITKEMLKEAQTANPSLKRIVPTLESIWASHEGWGNFDKTKVCDKICLDILQKKQVVETLAAKFQELFKRINDSIKPPAPPPVAAKPQS